MPLPKRKGAPQAIHTSTWFAALPPDHQRVGISLYKPRGYKREHFGLAALAPGKWYNTVPPDLYLTLYRRVLAALDPQQVADALFACGPNPVMVCYESSDSIAAGTKFCHRHMAAAWLETNLGITVAEIGHPDLKRWTAFERLGFPLPNWTHVPPEPENILAGG